MSLLLVLSGFVLTATLAALANGPLMRGIDAYKKKDYLRAQALLRQALKSAPEDSVAHYYLGNTLIKLKNPIAAKSEFKLASESSETEDIKENCKVALQKLQSPNTQKIEVLDLSKPGKYFKQASIRLDSIPFSAEEKKAIAPYLKQNGELDQSRSASMMKDLLPLDLKNKAQTMSSQDPALPGLLSDFLGQTQFGSALSAGERKSFIEDELHKRNIPMDSVLQMLKGKSGDGTNPKNNAAQDERAKVLKEVQENLDDQMKSQVGNSGLHLKQEGTSIYIRNYEHR